MGLQENKLRNKTVRSSLSKKETTLKYTTSILTTPKLYSSTSISPTTAIPTMKTTISTGFSNEPKHVSILSPDIYSSNSIVSTKSLTTQTRESISAKNSTTTQALQLVTEEVYLTCKEAVLHNINVAHGLFFVDPDNQGSITVECFHVTKAASYTGMYENHGYVNKNAYHYVNITRKENGDYEWKNRVTKWTLYPYEWNELRLGPDCPYYEDGRRYILFTDDGVWSGEFYTKEGVLKDFLQPNEFIKYARTLVLKRGLIFNIDSVNDNNNYWIGIENLARLTFNKTSDFILEFVHNSGPRSYVIYRDFTIRNQQNYAMSYTRSISEGQASHLLGYRKFKSWNGCPFDTSYWWDCQDKKQSPLVTNLSDMSSNFIGIEIYISTSLYPIV